MANKNGSLWQKVLIKDQKGVVHVLGYRMLETDMGWKINGVQLFPSPGADAQQGLFGIPPYGALRPY